MMIGKRGSARMSGTNLARAADHNQRVTLHAIRVAGSLTRVELAGIIGLTPPAIANITRRLLSDGLIEEAGQLRGGRGQPPTRLVIRRDACHSIGVNVDRDHVTIVVVDFAGQTLARVSKDVSFALPDDVRSLYRGSIDAMLRDAGVERDSLVGLGCAVPDDLGLIDIPGRPTGYAAWDGIDLGALFAEPIDLPVFVENDAAAAAMGEMQLGLGQRFSSFFYILISSGLGGGLVVDGTYFRGANGRSGELGFMHAPNADGVPEQIQHLVSVPGLSEYLTGAGCAPSGPLDAGLGEADTPGLSDWIEAAAAQLYVPLEAVNCLINPGVVLIGGRLPSAVVDRLAAESQRLLGARATNVPVIAPVRRAALSDDAPAVGAAILPFSHFLLPKLGALWKASAAN